MKENRHREPTLFIVGNHNRVREIEEILTDKFEGLNINNLSFNCEKLAYFVNSLGNIECINIDYPIFTNAVERGFMKEYKLPEQTKLQPFDRVVARVTKGHTWVAGFYSHYADERLKHILTNDFSYEYCLPFNEQTAKLIGTSDEWEGGNND